MPTLPASAASSAQINTAALTTDLITAMGWVRGISGIVLVLVGLVGIIWGIFKKDSAEEEAAEEAAKEEYQRKREAIIAS
jgi:flagellar basal body-associated protein FliL